ncbi:hypothetical protein FBU30_011043 [Linnemannia zychae]|nr:hypothetical protein FBU30_011043 [Linnemannia zychae]
MSKVRLDPFLVINNSPIITQQALDDSLIVDKQRCDQEVSEDVFEKHGPDHFLLQSFRDIETGEDQTWFRCKGERTVEKSTIDKLPYLLVLGQFYTPIELDCLPKTLSLGDQTPDDIIMMD